jgi:hypothetical protein
MRLASAALIGAAALVAFAQPAARAAPAASAPPAAAPSGRDSCFRTTDIRSHRAADSRTLFVRLTNREVFRIDMAGACLSGAGPSDPLVIRSRPGSTLACRPIDLDISVARGVGTTSSLRSAARTPCIVQSMTRLTPDEVAALPARSRP